MLKICIFVFVGMCSASVVDYKKSDNPPKPFYELPCSSVGGVCMEEAECPDGKLVGVKGLCPLQQNLGVECCYSAVGKSSTTCGSRGGECRPSSEQCPPNLTFSEATDCEFDEKCCIFVD